jgi:hypothetical protein
MVQSTCLKCGGLTFEERKLTPHSSKVVIYVLQCVSCGGVVGIVPDNTIGLILAKHSAAIKKIADVLKARVTL